MSGPRIAIILIRDLPGEAGRNIMIRNIMAALDGHATEVMRLHSLLELHSFAQVAAACLIWLRDFLRGHPQPLQCLLYGSPADCEIIARRVKAGGFTHVYLDTVRCQLLLRAIRRHSPDMHIVADFDDLMSRRMENLVRLRQPFLTGFAARSFPAWLKKLAEGPFSRMITRYEALALRHAEREVAAMTNAVVLLSPVERDLLAARIPLHAPRLHAILPPAEIRAPAWSSSPSRFVFIGGDHLLQNRLVIDRLLALWRSRQPGTQLHIYGRQTRTPALVEGVIWHGFTASLEEVYCSGSILLYPCALRGGIKTKVPEAWSFGCPVLGNDAAFEGLELSHYPLMLPESEWGSLLESPERYRTLWLQAAATGQEYVARHLAPHLFKTAWHRALGLDQAASGYGVRPSPLMVRPAARNNTMFDAVKDAAGPAGLDLVARR